jgi:hypothetical protein
MSVLLLGHDVRRNVRGHRCSFAVLSIEAFSFAKMNFFLLREQHRA